MTPKCLLICALSLFMNVTCPAQKTTLNFRHISVADGLNDGSIMAMCQDKYGYMWFATLGALHRYNGHSIERFSHIVGDSTSAPVDNAWSIANDADGRLWLGYDLGLYEFDHDTNKFIHHPALKGLYIQQIVPARQHTLYLLTSLGVIRYDTQTGQTRNLSQINALLTKHPAHSLQLRNGHLFIGSVNGYVTYAIDTDKWLFTPFGNVGDFKANRILVDQTGNLWLSDFARFQLATYDPAAKQFAIFRDPKLPRAAVRETAYNDFVCDKTNTIWVTSLLGGLMKINASTHAVDYFFNAKTESLKNGWRNLRNIYLSNDANLFIGCADGVIYFQAADGLFTTVLPKPFEGPSPFARAMLEDRDGRWWFTSGDGVVRYNPDSEQTVVWKNETGKEPVIYFNSVRGIAEDREGTIWLATGKGINSYSRGATKFRFYTAADSIPNAFYYCANADSQGRIWFGTKDADGLYYFSLKTHRFYSLTTHPLLKKYSGLGARIVFEDSQRRLWIGHNGNGLVMLDERRGITRYWFNTSTTKATICGNTIVDIKEDKKGVIWVSTFNGVTGIDLRQNTYTWLTDQSFFKSTFTGPLAVDAKNRLWVGTGNGLYVVDEPRKTAALFDENSGMQSAAFTEHSGYTTKDGWMMLPTLRGFVRFDPMRYVPSPSRYDFFASTVEALNKSYKLPRRSNTELDLKPDENFLTITLEAINFINPTQTQYAYKLEGVDPDWVYSQYPKATYTNLDGGTYTFHYKVSASPGNWAVPEKTITLTIGTLFYKTSWFKGLILCLVGLLVVDFVRFRIAQRQRIHNLQLQSTRLERDKTELQYQNLINHLNPHFLFNSLTSLNSLILTSPREASQFLRKLSAIYRYILQNKDKELVPLRDELAFVQPYIDLQTARFGLGLRITIAVPDTYLTQLIVPVTLQNLLENAIKHNSIDEDNPLVIRIYPDEDYLCVANHLQKKGFVETSNKQGLASMKSMYHYLSRRAVDVIETDSEFIVKVPLIQP
ncbi:Sensor protein lytS [Fibrella aestuarina BUZ 2]|uniref:Sensor protein lytS n=1 Tax=Fibrella aestuarina BUZ 2 TaxID=1166018 RepID=I0K6B2_9BACT|nr:two-component regulator propeller domain-containing protein [Fibrella aestuarina]CCG99665.1 Sensor protein lytS [Fibrella aestuarina BUZ 2]